MVILSNLDCVFLDNEWFHLRILAAVFLQGELTIKAWTQSKSSLQNAYSSSLTK